MKSKRGKTRQNKHCPGAEIFFWDHFGWELCNRVFHARYMFEYIGTFWVIYVLIYTGQISP